MAQVFIIGRVTADFELQTSTVGNHYVRFGLAEILGYGEAAKTQYYQVWAWENDARHLIKRKVKQGSLIWVSGSIELEEYTRQDGTTKDKRLKVKLDSWDYVALGKHQASQNTESELLSQPAANLPSAGELNGEKEPLPD